MKAYLHNDAEKYLKRLNLKDIERIKEAIIKADDYWTPVTEPATPEEAAMINERAKDFPANFVPLD